MFRSSIQSTKRPLQERIKSEGLTDMDYLHFFRTICPRSFNNISVRNMAFLISGQVIVQLTTKTGGSSWIVEFKETRSQFRGAFTSRQLQKYHRAHILFVIKFRDDNRNHEWSYMHITHYRLGSQWKVKQRWSRWVKSRIRSEFTSNAILLYR